MEEQLAPSSQDLTAVTEMTRDLAYRQLDAQLQASDNYDTKTGGLLAFDGAAIAAILALKDAFHGWWGIPAAGILLSAVLAGLALWNRAYDTGPEVAAFYERVSLLTAAEANIKLVTELDASLQSNDRTVRNKAGFFLGSLGASVLTAAVTAVLLWLLR